MAEVGPDRELARRAEQGIAEPTEQIAVDADLRRQAGELGISQRNRNRVGRQRDAGDDIVDQPAGPVVRQPASGGQMPNPCRLLFRVPVRSSQAQLRDFFVSRPKRLASLLSTPPKSQQQRSRYLHDPASRGGGYGGVPVKLPVTMTRPTPTFRSEVVSAMAFRNRFRFPRPASQSLRLATNRITIPTKPRIRVSVSMELGAQDNPDDAHSGS